MTSNIMSSKLLGMIKLHPIMNTCYEHTYSRSHTLSILHVIPMGGFVILFILLFILSLKTRNIRRSNFKETKRTNIFIIFFYFCLLFNSNTCHRKLEKICHVL